MSGSILFIGIGILLVAVIYGILGARILAAKMREAKADRLLRSGARAEAAALYAEGVKFNLGRPSGVRCLEKALAIYRQAGLKEVELSIIKEEYEKLGEQTNLRIADLNRVKMRGRARMKEIERVSQEAGQKVDGLLARLPRI